MTVRTNRKLPPPATLRRLYVDQNLSLAAIAKEYGVKPVGVRHTLERDARRDGVPWPLKSRGKGPSGRAKKIAAMRVARDEVRSIMVAAEIREAMAKFGLSQTKIAPHLGIGQPLVSQILLSGKDGYCLRTTAQKVERGIRRLEHRAALSAAMRRRHATVRAA